MNKASAKAIVAGTSLAHMGARQCHQEWNRKAFVAAGRPAIEAYVALKGEELYAEQVTTLRAWWKEASAPVVSAPVSLPVVTETTCRDCRMAPAFRRGLCEDCM